MFGLRNQVVLTFSCLCRLGAASGSERFPLGGAMTNGVGVRVTGVLTSKDNMFIDFERSDGTPAIRFRPDRVTQTLERQFNLRGFGDGWLPAQTWGGWPFGDDNEFQIDFVRADESLEVWVNSQRTPWFDFEYLQNTRMTHVRIYTGIQRGSVLPSRPKCTTPCHPDECRNSAGKNTCFLLDADQCFTTAPGERCLTSQDSDKENAFNLHCCEGRGTPVTFDNWQDKWVELGDDEIVTRGCVAFGGNCNGLGGHFGKIMSVNEQEQTMDLWVPDFTQEDTSSLYTVPRYVARFHQGQGRSVFVSSSVMQSMTVDASTYLITDSSSNLLKGQFVHLIHEVKSGTENDDWRAYTDMRWERINNDGRGVQILLTDIEFSPTMTACDDMTTANGGQWRDQRRSVGRSRHNCQDHAEGPYCTLEGKETAEFYQHHGDGKTFADYAIDDLSADEVCCACGGGLYGGSLDSVPTGLPFEVEGENRYLM